MENTTVFDPVEKIWHCTTENVPVFDPNSSLGLYFFNLLKKKLSNVLQISDTDQRVVTNEQLLIWAVSIAKQLKSKFNLNHQDVIGIAAEITTYVLPVEIACLFNGTPFHALNPHSPKEVYAHLLNITKPKLIFCDGGNYERIAAAVKSFKPIIYTISDHIDGVPKVEDLLQPMSIETVLNFEPTPLVEAADQTVVIMCSSGTTGLQKAVCLSNQSFAYFPSILQENDVIYSPSNLDWISGLFASLLPCFSYMARVITTTPFSVEYFLKLVQKYKLTNTTLPYFHALELINSPAVTAESLESIRSVFIVGAKVSFDKLNRLQELFKNATLVTGYGLTEFSGVTLQFFDGISKSSGKLAPGISVCICNDDGQKLGPNEFGEIWLKCKRNWKGYYNNIEATNEILDASNWLHSGDIGFFDDNLELHVVDRKKDIYKYENNNYSPSEIEHVISELPDVMHVCVVGVEDGIYGQAATAAVVKRPDSKVTTQEIKDHVKQRLQLSYKQLHGGVWYFDKLPYNQNGKQMKREVAAMIKQKMASD